MSRLPDSIKLPKQLFKQSKGPLKRVLKHSQDLISIQTVVRSMVPGDIHVALFSNGLLHLVTPTAALATRIKYQQNTLIAALRRHDVPLIVKSIKVSVRPEFQQIAPTTRPALPISAENGQQIASAAQYIEDEPLRKALINLSERAR